MHAAAIWVGPVVLWEALRRSVRVWVGIWVGVGGCSVLWEALRRSVRVWVGIWWLEDFLFSKRSKRPQFCDQQA